MTRLCFIDTETTGLDPDRYEVYEIGLIVRNDDDEPDQEYRWWLPVDLGRADPVALKVGRFFERHPDIHSLGLSRMWFPDKRNGGIEDGEGMSHGRQDTARSLMRLTAGAHLVGAVPSFDAAFLGRFLRAHGCCPAWHYHLVDVEALAAGWLATMPKDYLDTWLPLTGAAPPWNSNSLSNAVGVDPDRFDRHTALGDARWARAIYDAVMRRPA